MSVPAGWRLLSDEVSRLYSPAGFRLVDEFTGAAPLGEIRTRLDREVALNVWEEIDGAGAILTPSATLTFPGLGRKLHPAGAPTRRYRVRVDAELYRPAYRNTKDGEDFFAPPWDDANPPVPITMGPVDMYLMPGPGYPFPTFVRVLRGVVVNGLGSPVPDVLVRQAGLERVITDERGVFALPLRWATSGMNVDAIDARNARSGLHTLTLPNDLRTNQTITVT